MRLGDALRLPPLRRIRVVAGAEGLRRDVRWVHVVDIPDVRSWVRPRQLLLTTGYAWPRGDEEQRNLVRDLNNTGLAGVGMAVPQFFEHFPCAAREEADELGFPLLEIPWEIPFATIAETVNRSIASEQTAILERLESIHRSLTKAAIELDSLEGIVRRIAGTLDRGTFFADGTGQLLTGHSPDESEFTPPDGVVEAFQSVEVQQLVQGARSALQLALAGKPCLIGPVRQGQRLLGFLTLVDEKEPFSDWDLRALEHAATVVALYFSHEQRVELVHTRLRYGLVDSLVEGRWDDSPEAVERARLFGFDPDADYTVCVVFLRGESVPLDGEEAFMRRETAAMKVRTYLVEQGVAPLLTVSLNRVVALVPERVDLHQLWRLFRPDEVALGVSEVHTGVDGIPAAFRQAVQALEWNKFEGLGRYVDTLLPRLLAGDGTARATFVQRTLGPLLRTKRKTLLHTLRILARNDYAHRTTAELLHVHPNTLRYRVQRIEQLLETDLSRPDPRFHVRLAVEILDHRYE